MLMLMLMLMGCNFDTTFDIWDVNGMLMLIWLVVDQPLWKNMKVSWDDYSPYMETIKHVPNHQPAMFNLNLMSLGCSFLINVLVDWAIKQNKPTNTWQCTPW